MTEIDLCRGETVFGSFSTTMRSIFFLCHKKIPTIKVTCMPKEFAAPQAASSQITYTTKSLSYTKLYFGGGE